MGNQQKILIIEDEADFKFSVEGLMFKKTGYEGIFCLNSLSALTAVRENHIVAVVSDVNIGNVNGFELVPEILKVTNVPVLIMSAELEEGYEDKARKLGYSFIAKPFDLSEWFSMINNLL